MTETHKANILVLGGAGYIGSHTCKALSQQGYNPIVVDNLSRGHERAVQWGPFEKADLHDTARLTAIMKEHKVDAVIHFAALIEVNESMQDPGAFYTNNVEGTNSVLKAMQAAEVGHIVFSSTAAVYGQPDFDGPLHEDLPLNPINPYGDSKLAAERLIRAFEGSAGITSACLRYFNACGASPDGDIGEMHYPETHLLPLVVHTAQGLREKISMFGTDYDTPDGTCVRDYVHVEDLADAHIKAVQHLIDGGETTYCNLGTGKGNSVREIITAVQNASGINDFTISEEDRRPGDPKELVADNSKAKQVLGWEPKRTLAEMTKTALEWHATDTYKDFWKVKKAQNTPSV